MQPKNLSALKLLSLAFKDTKNLDSALNVIKRAEALDPADLSIKYTLGSILIAKEHWHEALDCYEKIVSFDQANVSALYNKALILQKLKNLPAAIETYTIVLKKDPHHLDALNNRGVALLELGKISNSIEDLDLCILLAPSRADTYNNRGIANQKLKNFELALADFTKAISHNETYVDAIFNKGNVLSDLDRPLDALRELDKALSLRPEAAHIWINKSNITALLGKTEDAINCLNDALAICHECHEILLNNKAALLSKIRKYDEASTCYREALALRPDYPEALNNLAALEHEFGNIETAIDYCSRALQLKPNYPEALNNYGNILKDLGKFSDALASYDAAILLNPTYIEAKWNKSLLLLLLGEYSEGWRLYETRRYRQESGGEHNIYKTKYATSDNLNSTKILLIYSEQGLGDCIQFARYLTCINALGRTVYAKVPSVLYSLFASTFTHYRLLKNESETPPFDICASLMSLPSLLTTTNQCIPCKTPYIYADLERVNFWHARLGERRKLRVGIAWSGSSHHRNDRNRSIPLCQFLKIFDLNIEFHSLQTEYRNSDLYLISARPQIRQHQEHLSDFSDTAALVTCLDLIISVDTSVAHLAGALGKPVWILLPHIPDFRWLLNRTDTPWYPSAKLYRQPQRNCWKSVFECIEQDLITLITESNITK